MFQPFLDQLIAIDHDLFHKINTTWAHPLFDSLMPAITDLHKAWWFSMIAVPIIVVIGLLNAKRKTHYLGVIFCGVASFAISDSVSYRIIKPAIERQRPPVVLQDVKLRTESHSGLSFPSNHAANMFALAAVFGYYFKQNRKYFYLIAGTIAYSRVYVGVHFPMDVAAGAFVGLFSGFVAIWLATAILHLRRPMS